MESDELKAKIWASLEGLPNEYELKYLILDYGSEKYSEGLNKMSEIAKGIYAPKDKAHS